MPKKGKLQPEKRIPRVAGIIKENTDSLFAMAKRVPEFQDRSTPVLLEAYIKERAEEYGDTVSKTHIYRMRKGKRAVGADVLDVVARAFGLEAWMMLVSGMNPANEPVIIRSEAERILHKQLQTSWRVIDPEANNAEKGSAGSPVVGGHTESPEGGSRNAHGNETNKTPPAKNGREAKT